MTKSRLLVSPHKKKTYIIKEHMRLSRILRPQVSGIYTLIRTSMASSSITPTATGFSSSFHGSWGTSITGQDYSTMLAKTAPTWVIVGNPLRHGPMIGNVNEGKGLFAPLVVITRNIVGK